MKTYSITSGHNETYKMFLELLGTRGIVEHGQALVYGKKAVLDVMALQPGLVRGLVTNEEGNEVGIPEGIKSLYRLKSSLFNELDVFGIRSPILLVQLPEFKKWDPLNIKPDCYLHIPFQDPSNVGAVLRSAAAFGLRKIVLSPTSAHPFHPRSSRAASGCLFLHEFFKMEDASLSLTEKIPVIALDTAGVDVSKFKFPSQFILVPGLEGPGLPKGVKIDQKIGVPISSSVESLNVSVATGIVLHQWAQSARLS